MSKKPENHNEDEDAKLNKLIREASKGKPGEFVRPSADAVEAYLMGTATEDQAQEITEALINSEEFAREILQMSQDLGALAESEAKSQEEEIRQIPVPERTRFLEEYGPKGFPQPRTESFLGKLSNVLWPKVAFPLKPALLYVLLLLLAIPTYLWFTSPTKHVITIGSNTTEIGGDLSGGHSIVRLEPGIEQFLHFHVSENVKCQTCDLAIVETHSGKPVLRREKFAAINLLRKGEIMLPPDFPPGLYTIIITDPQTGQSTKINFRAEPSDAAGSN
jgi:hypothetical protein